MTGSTFWAMRRDLIKSKGIEKRAAVNPFFSVDSKVQLVLEIIILQGKIKINIQDKLTATQLAPICVVKAGPFVMGSFNNFATPSLA